MSETKSELAAAAGKRKAIASNVDGQFEDSESPNKTRAPKEESPVEASATAVADTDPGYNSASENPPQKKTKTAESKAPEPEDNDASEGRETEETPNTTSGALSNLSDYEKCSIFPQKLHQLLKNNEAPDAIWWLEDGDSFAIEPEKFTKVMNKVSRTGRKKVKLDSILRNLYRWGFKKLKARNLPTNVLAYSHPNFKKDSISNDMQNFPKHPEPIPVSPSAAVPPPSALARALSARAQEGYGDDWNQQGAAGNALPIMQAGVGGPSYSLAQSHFAPSFDQQQMQMHLLHQQRQQMVMQQEMMFLSERQRQEQSILLERAAAQRRLHSALNNYRFDNPSSALDYPPAGPPNYPY